MSGNWRGDRPKTSGSKSGWNAPAPERKHAPVGWRRSSESAKASRSSKRWRRKLVGVSAVVLLGAAVYWFVMLLWPVDARLFVEAGRYDPELVSPSLGLAPQELEETLPKISVASFGAAGTSKGSGADVKILFIDAALLLRGSEQSPLIADDQSLPDAQVPRAQPLAAGAPRPASAIEWFRPVIEDAGKCPTLLVLDVSRPAVNWRAGILAPVAAQRLLDDLRNEVDRVVKEGNKELKLAILASARPGERVWTDHGRSAFAQIAVEALRGAADGAIDGRRNSRVSAEEFHRFVSRKTAAWVTGNRDEAGQHPVWITAGPDFDVSYVTKGSLVWPTAAAVDPKFLKDLEAAWQLRDAAWKQQGTATLSAGTLDWQRANHLLRQAERAWLGGQGTTARNLLTEAEGSLSQLKPEPAGSFEPPVPAAGQLASFRGELPENVSPEQFDKLVEVRRAAQSAAVSLPRALPLIESLLTKADELRRQAEDAAFLGDQEQAGKLSAEALSLYQTSLQAAGLYGRSLAGLERSLAGLPFLAEWAAAQPVSMDLIRTIASSDGNVAATPIANDNVAKVANLLADARRLREDLERLEANPPDRQGLVGALQQLETRAGRISGEAAAIEAALNAEAEELLNRTEKVAARRMIRRHSIERLLANPLLSGTTRRRLIEEIASIDGDLRLSSLPDADSDPNSAAGSADKEDGWDLSKSLQSLTQTAAWQGLWALRVRGLDPNARTVDDLVKNQWSEIANISQLPASQQQESALSAYLAISTLGERLRASWNSSFEEISATRGYDDENVGLWRDLTFRDRVGRSLHGYDSVQLIAKRKRDPAADLAAWSSATTSVFLARQALDDFYAGAPGAAHWFDVATRHHLEAARGVVRGVPSISPVIAGRARNVESLWEERRGTRFWLQPEPDRVTFGSYDQRLATLKLEVDGQPPRGTAAAWMNLEATASPGTDSAGEPAASGGPVRIDTVGRRAIAIGNSEGSPGGAAAFDLVRTSPDCNVVRLPARFFFRGHGSAAPLVVTANPCPPGRRTVVVEPAPLTGKLVVSGIDPRPILFVLDCSLSMNDPIQPQGTRFAAASNALLGMVNDLRSNAADAQQVQRVGLIPFGHRANTKREGDGVVARLNPDWPANDLPASASTDYQRLVSLGDVNRRNGEEFLFEQQFRRLKPWGITPLIGAIRYAFDSIPDGEPGTIVVITDGADTDLETGNKALARAALADLTAGITRRREKGVPVQIHIVEFAIAAGNPVLAEISKAVVTPSGGQLLNAADGAALANALKSATQARKYRVVPVGQEAGVEYDLTETTNELARGSYRITFGDAAPFDVSIAGGEELRFNLQPGRFQALKYQTGDQPRALARATNATPGGPDLLVGRNYQINGNTAELRLSLDIAVPDDGQGGPPQTSKRGYVPRPGDVWFEVTDGSGQPVQNVTWKVALGGYDLPTWELTIPSAPTDQRLNVTAFWRTTPLPQDAGLVFAPSDVGREVTIPLANGAQTMVLKGFGRDPRRPGIVTARLEPRGSMTVGAELEGLWAAIDPGKHGEGQFQPAEMRTERIWFYEEGAVEFAFSVGPEFDPSTARLGLIPPPERRTGAARATLRLERVW